MKKVSDFFTSKKLTPIDTLVKHWCTQMKDKEENLKNEYSSIKKKEPFPNDESRKDCNKAKNRYTDVLPYDYNRVRLNILDQLDDTDFINASEIKLNNESVKFIATQGPLENTIFDFWRMVYERKVKAIVMLTNLVESGKKKCEMYWNDADAMKCKHLTIKRIEIENNLNYEKRQFLIQSSNSGEDNLVVDHYFYINWSDHGVPEDTQTIVELIDRVNMEHDENHWPIVVHCSAGVGRTGTYIALDMQLSELANKKKIDVNKCVDTLRSQRIMMVQTSEQYIFIHLTLLERYAFGNTLMDQNKRRTEFIKLLNSDDIYFNRKSFDKLIQNLNKVPNTYSTTEFINKYPEKFKSKAFPPYDDACVKLKKINENENSVYIDASKFHSKQYNANFFMVSDPAEENVSDFCRLVLEHRPKIIVSFSKPLYLPKEGVSQRSHNYQVFNKSKLTINDVAFYNVEFSDTVNNENHNIHYFDHTHNWPESSKFPVNDDTFIRLISFILNCKHDEHMPLIVVQSSDAGDRCAIFIALLLLINRIRIHGKFDVVQIIRMLRKTRKNLISDVETLTYLYSICCSDNSCILEQTTIKV